VRYVFIDEAGTAPKDPIRVVAGVIVHADKHCMRADQAVKEVLESIPGHIRPKCPVFHAKSIWGDPKLRDNWSFDERKRLLCSMMSLPKELELSLALGACERTMELPPELLASRKISLTQAQHGIAFQECIARADSFINRYANHNEVATVISEDVPESKSLLRHMARFLLKPGYDIPKEDVRLVQIGDAALEDVESFRVRKVSRIRMPIHFVEKRDEPLLQIADACAFAFRRFLSEQDHGRDFVQAIIGGSPNAKDFPLGEWGGGIFSWSDGPGFKPSWTFGPWQG
jgi:uncharacterized protein DUF3800